MSYGPRSIHEKVGVPLGTDIAPPLGEYVHGVGGGHAMASGVSGTAEIHQASNNALFF